MRLFRLAVAIALANASAHAASTPWHHDLSYASGGYWRCRVAVAVRNDTDADAVGRAVEVTLGQGPGQLRLVGHAVAALRVCDGRGAELLYDLLDAAGQPKREGTLAEGDRLAVGVECPRGASAIYFVYTDNPQAWAVADWLGAAAPFANGGFEQGSTAPAGWTQAEASDQHRLSWVAESPHGGKRCVRCDVAPGAEPSWVKWAQNDVGVVPDADYRFEAWAKAKDAKGQVGWFLHVHGQKPMAINRVADSGDGTYDWKRVEILFHTPPDATRATVGTVLRGTGTAWYDDAGLTLLTKQTALQAVAGAVERHSLSVAPARGDWLDGSAGYRVELKVRNWADAAAAPLVYADLAPLTRRLPLAARGAEIRVADPASDALVPALRLDQRLLFAADVPPQTEKTYHAYFHRASGGGKAMTFADLVASKANLAPNPGFETGEPLPTGWTLSAESDVARRSAADSIRDGVAGYIAARDPEAHSGKWCARLEIPPGAPLKWSGWHTAEIPVRPLTTYLYAAWLRCRDVNDGSVQIHGHFHDAEGKLCEATKYFGAGPGLKDTQGWTLLQGFVETPADCASVQLHLTMNAHGTVWHDDVFFGEAAAAIVGATQIGGTSVPPVIQRGYAAWLVNPIVKVFPDDLPAEAPSRIEVAAARNELEPFQLVLRAARDLRDVAITIDPPRNRDGQALPDVALHLVGYVPIDHPSSYYRTDVPAWYRKLPPRGQTGCDGWAGLWPDPLPRIEKPFALAANTTQPVWATVRVPADAKPGTYSGKVAVRPANAEALELPLEVTVWDFALPKESHLGVIYDFRAQGLREEAMRAWWKFMADHRVCPGILPPPKFDYKGGQVTLDTAEFDRAAAYCLDELGMRVFYSPWFFYAFGWAHAPRKLFGFEPFTKEYTDAYTKCLKAYMDHLRKKGWADKMILYISDEPHFSLKEVVEQMLKVCRMIRSVEPKMRIYSSTWEYCPEWAGQINVWGAGPHGSFPVETLRARQQAGDIIWFTTDGHMCTDTPYCAIERLLPWLCWKYGVQAYEFWGVNWWTYDPWERGWHRFISQSDDGQRYYYVRYPNGDGYLAYPGKRIGVDGPVSTIRLEQAREGVEDFEYLYLLDQLIAEAKKRGVDVRDAERARADAEGLVSIPNRGGRYSTSLLPDPDVVPRLRAAVAKAIVRLMK